MAFGALFFEPLINVVQKAALRTRSLQKSQTKRTA
jgi:hypothetical protein